MESVQESDIHFLPPDEGTPAYEALAANANVKVSLVSKGMRKIPGINRLKMKKIARTLKTKRHKRKKHFSRNFKGKVIDGLHELYTLTAGMMLGMRCAVGHAKQMSSLHLSLEDFNYVEKITFPPGGNTKPPHITPPHSLAHTFKMKSYAPKVFRRLRDYFGIDSAGYMLSICGDYNYLEFISNSKSGQFFFYSHDGRYMIKTQTTAENRFLQRILPHYYKYVTENPHTQIVRYFGMHRVKMYHLRRNVHFVIMASVFDTPEKINLIYDLKGSLIGRKATPKERESGGVLKDVDLIEDNRTINLGSKKEKFLAQLTSDAMFLAQHNIMDYSLLVGIHDRSKRRTRDPPKTISLSLANFNIEAASEALHLQPKAPMIKQISKMSRLPTTRSNTPFRRGVSRSSDDPEFVMARAPSPPSRPLSKDIKKMLDDVVEEHQAKGLPKYSNHDTSNDGNNNNNSNSNSNNNNNSSSLATPPQEKDKDKADIRRSYRKSSSSGGGGTEGGGGGHPETAPPHFTSSDPLNESFVTDDSESPIRARNDRHRPGDRRFWTISERNRRTKSDSSSEASDLVEKDRKQLPPPDSTEGSIEGMLDNDDSCASIINSADIDEYEINDIEEGEEEEEEEEGGEEEEEEGSPMDGEDDELSEHNDEGDSIEDTYGPLTVADGDGGADYFHRAIDNDIEDKGNATSTTAAAGGGSLSIILSSAGVTNDIPQSTNDIKKTSKDKSSHDSKDKDKDEYVSGLQLEGAKVTRLFRDVDSLGSLTRGAVTIDSDTYGPGCSNHAPWTGRIDGGINGRNTEGRTNEIYYVGIIDILCQYNATKRVENLFKGMLHDRRQISAVDSYSYAKRFIAFMDEHIK